MPNWRHFAVIDLLFPPSWRRVLDVARELTRSAYKVSDDQMARVKADFGEPKLVALVQLVAFGNFRIGCFCRLAYSMKTTPRFHPPAFASSVPGSVVQCRRGHHDRSQLKRWRSP